MFKKGDKVKLISTRHGDERYDPVWGGAFGKITGTIIGKKNAGVNPNLVRWTVGGTNNYSDEDLAYIEPDNEDDFNVLYSIKK